MTRMVQYLEYLFLRAVCAVIRLIPFRSALRLARFVGRILYYLMGSRRRIALQNLRLAFGGEKPEAELRRIAVKSFENLAMIAIEFIWIPKILKHLNHYVTMEVGPGKEALKQEQGFIFVVSHFGNWEWMAIASAANGLPMNAVARPLRNPFVYEYVKKLRGATGLKSIDKMGAARGTIRALERNEVVAILIDQHQREGSVRVPFFGREASATTLPAMLAVKKRVPIFPVFFYRCEGTPSRVVMTEKPLQTAITGDDERDLYENTKRYMHAIEEEIRKRPGDWLWMHRRWR